MDPTRRGGQGVTTAGERWVERYLLPVLDRRARPRGAAGLRVLQIEPDDETEAIRLRRAGHRCDVAVLADSPRRALSWQDRPLVWRRADALGEAGTYDLVLTGYFGRIGGTPAGRLALAREIGRVCTNTGAFLTAIGNRLCPIDFTGNGPRLHGPWCRSLVTLREMEEIFVAGAGFSAVQPLALTGHFGMATATGPLRIVAAGLEAHWRWVAVPERRWAYASPFNPTLMLWIEK